jgi:hypothetical protein
MQSSPQGKHQQRKWKCTPAVAMEAAIEKHNPFRILKQV